MKIPHLRSELRETLGLALPIMAGQVGQMLMGTADTVMVGRVGTVPLAACALANTVMSVGLMFGIGLLASVSIQVSHAHGAGRPDHAAESLRHGLLLALVVGLAMGFGIQAGLPALSLLGQDPAVVREAGPFLVIIGWSLLFFLLGTVLKNFTEAQSSPWPAFWITMAGVLLNVVLNVFWIFGVAGFPALGLLGAGYATLVARIAIFLALLVYVLRAPAFRSALPARWFGGWHPAVIREQLHLGLPVGFQIVMEVGAFGAASLLMGWFGASALAAHQIALTCAATTFMVPLGLSMATTVRIGQVVGSGDLHRIRRIGLTSLGSVLVIMGASAVLFLLASEPLAREFLRDETVIPLAAHLLVVAGFFQLFDGAQVVGIGSLRGMKDVRVPALIAFTAYWVVALPLGWVLAFPAGFGPVGVWVGLAVGLAVAAVALQTRFWSRTRTVVPIN
ncbi:MAG: MATE family efflux transporter [Candidatus Methylacidiphilales bacterium]|nr:MATE family efflux transporter [Candidatus Methylacidiphilales bacterium]